MRNKLSLRDSKIFMVAAVLVIGTISMIIPTTTFAQSYDQQQYEDPYADPYATDNKKSSSVNIQKIKCINENTNVNGIDITEIPQNDIAAVEAQALEDGATNPNGNGPLNGDGINFDKNLVNICVNVNVNEQANAGEDRQTCEECFTQNLNQQEQTRLLTVISLLTDGQITTFEQLCLAISNIIETGSEQELQDLSNTLALVFGVAELSAEQFQTVLDCLNEVFNGALPQPTPP